MKYTNSDTQKHSITQDLLLTSGIAGFIGALIKTAFTGTAYLLDLTKDFGVMIAGQIVFHTKDIPLDTWHLSIATATHLLFGSLFAVGLGLIFRTWGTDFWWIKGSVYGLTVWLLMRNLLVNLSMPGGLEKTNAASVTVSFLSHMIYGVVTAFLIVKFGHIIRGSRER